MWAHVQQEAEELSHVPVFGRNAQSQGKYYADIKRHLADDGGDMRAVEWNAGLLDPLKSSIPKDVVTMSKAVKCAKYHFYNEKVPRATAPWGLEPPLPPPSIFFFPVPASASK